MTRVHPCKIGVLIVGEANCGTVAVKSADIPALIADLQRSVTQSVTDQHLENHRKLWDKVT